MSGPVRVAQWGTGAVGREAMLALLDDPAFDLVAVKVFGDAKHGADAGTLLGRPPVGVTASISTKELLAASPHCVIYAPRVPSVDEVCTLLRAGVDVLTTAFCFHPARKAPPERDRLLAACRYGGSTLHGSGLNPGNFSAAVPLALSGLTRRLDTLTLQERADWSVYESTHITFDAMRFGQPPGLVSEAACDSLAFTADLFRQQVWLLGDVLNAGLDEVATHHEVAVAEDDVPVFDRVIEAGTVNGQRWRWTGRSGGTDRVEIDCIWTVGPVRADWPEPQHGWTLKLEGEPSVYAHLLTLASHTKPSTMQEHVRAASVATAMQVVNAIPHVRAAPPGFVTAADLPAVRSLNGFGGPARSPRNPG